ncbi:MAG: aldo/keto reductase [Bacteroidota bacterium]|nr:aldo/keto reductase [Bacteroidota bacterium]
MLSIPQRSFGSTGLKASALGLGGGEIGGNDLDDTEVEKFLNTAVDEGITLIDTARAYGKSEERIGKFLSHRRNEIVLSTKVGYGIPGHQDWTASCIIAGVDEALRLLRTDYLDIVHLHSCPKEILQRGEVVEALLQCVETGKVRVAAYSGENEALDEAVASGKFGSIQCSVNLCDQRNLDNAVKRASEKGFGVPVRRSGNDNSELKDTFRHAGVIAKRPAANAPWRFSEQPRGHYGEQYWLRWKAMNVDPHGIEWDELFLRFAVFAPEVHSAIVGTRNIEHLRRNIACVNNGPLPDDLAAHLRSSFQKHDEGWMGLV